MKQQNEYVAKEAFTFPLFCLVCMALCVFWGCADGWPVGAIISTSFFGIITMCYVGKYLRFGRNYLKINCINYGQYFFYAQIYTIFYFAVSI